MRESLRVLINVKRERKEGTFIHIQRRKGAAGPEPTPWLSGFYISVRTDHENGRRKT